MGVKLQVPYPTHSIIERNLSGQDYKRDLWAASSFDIDVFGDKFWGDALRAEYPAAKVSNGTVTFTADNENSFLEIKSGSGSGDYAGQGLGLTFTGDRGAVGEFLLKTPATVTNFKMEIGFTDSHSDDAGAVNQKASPETSNAEDYAVFIVDTSDDANIAFHTAKANTEVVTADIQSVIASTFYVFGIRIVGDVVQGWIDGKLVASHAIGIEGGNKITPWVFSQARTGSERIVQLHKWECKQPAYS